MDLTLLNKKYKYCAIQVNYRNNNRLIYQNILRGLSLKQKNGWIIDKKVFSLLTSRKMLKFFQFKNNQ